MRHAGDCGLREEAEIRTHETQGHMRPLVSMGSVGVPRSVPGQTGFFFQGSVRGSCLRRCACTLVTLVWCPQGPKEERKKEMGPARSQHVSCCRAEILRLLLGGRDDGDSQRHTLGMAGSSALKVRDRARFARCTACSPRLCDDACRVPAELGARGATAPAREGAGAAAAGGRTARQPAQQRPAQRPPAQQPDQPVRALRGEYCRPAALRRPGGSTRSNFASRARAEAPAARARPAASRRRRNMAYSTALEEEEEAGWQCCMPPRGSFGVLSPSQGAAEGVRNRDNPPAPESTRAEG